MVFTNEILEALLTLALSLRNCRLDLILPLPMGKLTKTSTHLMLRALGLFKSTNRLAVNPISQKGKGHELST